MTTFNMFLRSFRQGFDNQWCEKFEIPIKVKRHLQKTPSELPALLSAFYDNLRKYRIRSDDALLYAYNIAHPTHPLAIVGEVELS